MKSTIIKTISAILLASIMLNLVTSSNMRNSESKVHHKKHKQVQLVKDMNGFNSDIQQVVRRAPSVTTVTKLGNYRLTPPSDNIYMSNSNTSNLPNVGFLGHTAELVGMNIC